MRKKNSCHPVTSLFKTSSVGAARKVSPDWSQETMTCFRRFRLSCKKKANRKSFFEELLSGP